MFKRINIALRSAIHSFWFLPLIFSLLAVCLFGITFYFDNTYTGKLLIQYGPPFSIGPDGARQLMGTIAGSLITVASLVFSMTLISLTVAASNIGARLLLRYMNNRSIQVTLGIFLAGFIFALLTLSAIGKEADQVPRFSVFIGMGIAVFCFIWLAFAFNHLAKAIQVDQALSSLSVSICAALGKLYVSTKNSKCIPKEKFNGLVSFPIKAKQSGYVESINRDLLTNKADEIKGIFRLTVKIGTFVMPGEIIAELYLDKPSSDKSTTEVSDLLAKHNVEQIVIDAILIASNRSDLDDPFFCLRLINEIATRALSPGINDIYTALTCIDQAAVSVEHVIRNGMPKNGWVNEEEQLRLVFSDYEFQAFLDAAFESMRKASDGYAAFSAKLLDRLGRLLMLANSDDEKRGLEEFIGRVYETALETAKTEHDREVIEQSYSQLKAGDN